MALHLAIRRCVASTTRSSLSSSRFQASRHAFLSTEVEGASAGFMTLNFNLPHESIYSGAKVTQVIVPGAAGEYGITSDHTPIIAQLKPGILQILFPDGQEADKYFVPGGFSISHPNSVTDISVPDAVKIEDIDPSAVASGYEQARLAYSSAETGSVAQAEAQIDMETFRAMAVAVGVSVA